MPNAKFYPHAAPKMSVSDYVKEAAALLVFAPIQLAERAPAGLVLCLIVSGVTWRFVDQNCYSTSLIAWPESTVNDESHEAFLMKQAGKLLADVKAWLEAR